MNAPASGPRRVLVVGTDRDTYALLEEWLADWGWQAHPDHAPDDGRPAALVVVDVPFPRRTPSEPLQRLASRHAGTPILALSATLHPNVPCSGEVARALGVAGVLPKPLRRDALLQAVRTLAGPAAP